MQRPGIAILDNGGQLTRKIAQNLTKQGAFAQTYNPAVDISELHNAKGVVLSGGPASVYQEGSPRCPSAVFELGVPILAICYGWQDVAQRFGGKVERKKVDADTVVGEYGKAEMHVRSPVAIFEGMESRQPVWMSHGDTVTQLPDGYELVASTPDCEYAAAWNSVKKVVGVQFHPEADDTRNGNQMFYNFVRMCGSNGFQWTMADHLAASLPVLRETAKGRKVIHLTSGGGDSTVAAAMLKLALPDGQTEFVYMNPGIMRKGETEYVRRTVTGAGIPLTVLDTSKELEHDLAGVTDPEQKRKIIGTHFVRMAEHHAAEHGYGNDWVLGQGTIWPDHIESQGTVHSAKIKTHHNRVQEVLDMMTQGRVVEPNLLLFKDELRQLATIIGSQHPQHATLGTVFAKRHPFPGPGLAIRTICSDGNTENLSAATYKATELVAKYDLRATVLPIRTVGQQGDERSFAHPALLTGEFGDWESLASASVELTNKMRGTVNRAVYAWEPRQVDDVALHEGYVTRSRLDTLREADAIVMHLLEQTGWMEKIGQCPTISVPVGINGSGKDSVAIRPIHTKDYMTGQFARLPEEMLDEVAQKTTALGFSGLLVDVTNKPPGTIEWE